MKTKELIEKLQALDPSGDTEVCVGNLPIYFLERQPSYYDGPRNDLIIDKSKEPYYSVVGYRIVSSGEKIQVFTLSLEDCLENDPDLPVEADEQHHELIKRLRLEAELLRRETRT